MDTRDGQIKYFDEVPKDEWKFLREIPIGQIVVINGYRYSISRVNVAEQEVVLRPKGAIARRVDGKVDL